MWKGRVNKNEGVQNFFDEVCKKISRKDPFQIGRLIGLSSILVCS